MNRRSLPAAAALATAAALLLTACGGGGDSKSKDSGKIAGADQGASKSASPSASASASADVDRPKFSLPSDIKYVFEWPKTGDKEKDAVMSDAEQLIKARDYAIVKQDPLQAGYRFYTEGELTASTQEYVAAYVKAKSRITGTIRYYGPVISLNGPDKATFAFCQDQGKGYDLHLQTNKINKTPVTKNSYVLYNSALRKNDKGVWVTTALNSDRGSSKCQP
ncbi:hypothetical protein OG372_21180 [Streptomyces sp. NBC_01020]|uniref:hypothetical protein n=1 Tax=unclassified Streptomyces TaxID=2593676 RepID=UPI002E1BBEB6|nr:hypothetical protein OG372_21180 [Streptomyces sp. NBC_01020]